MCNSVQYYYDSEGVLFKKSVIFPDGTEQITCYENPEDGNTITKLSVCGKTVISHSKSDSFGRAEFEELQLGTGVVSRRFEYEQGVATDEHIENEMLKSTPTTYLVSEITLSDGRTLAYEYDEEERITKVVDSLEGITEYTYDELGQLLTESVNGEVINQMTYDNYGNILTKDGKTYTYDSVWKDLLVKVGNKEITYDKQGNPLTYLGHTLTWEKGRQLKSFDNIQYTYNGSGIRTSKTVDGVKHDFVLDGVKILKETYGSHTIETLYDNEDSVWGIIYNGTPYYFLKNLQGDIISITDSTGTVVANYTYDAWGKVLSISGDNIHIGAVNPYRYRGYYYDSEINMYYLQSRYYDPETGRFVNEDILICSGVLGLDLYSYCENSIINFYDPFGYKAGTAFSSADEAAIDFCTLFNRQSIIRNIEILTLIYSKKTKGKTKYYYYTPQSDLSDSSFNLNIGTFDVKKTHKLVAIAHTHGAYSDYYKDGSEEFSEDDIKSANTLKLNMYLVTPGGKFFKYLYKTKKAYINTKYTFCHDYRSIKQTWLQKILKKRHKCSKCVN